MENNFDLLSSVVSQLSHDFPQLNIYTTQIEQGFERPCIVAKIASCDLKKQLGEFYFATFKLIIDYYTTEKTDIESEGEYAEKLALALWHIKEPEIKAMSVNVSVADDCHEVQALYKLRVKQAPEQVKEKMEKIELVSRLGEKDANQRSKGI